MKESCHEFCRLLEVLRPCLASHFISTVNSPAKLAVSKCTITGSRLTVITQGALYWWTPNIPTIRKAIWMKLAIIGAHINPRKSKTCRSTTTSWEKTQTENTLLACDEWQWVFIVSKSSLSSIFAYQRTFKHQISKTTPNAARKKFKTSWLYLPIEVLKWTRGCFSHYSSPCLIKILDESFEWYANVSGHS